MRFLSILNRQTMKYENLFRMTKSFCKQKKATRNKGLQFFWGFIFLAIFCISTGFNWHSPDGKVATSNLDFYNCLSESNFLEAINSWMNTPTIDEVNTTNPNDCDVNNGSISISATGTGAIEYSIDGGMTWQGFNTFLNVGAGNYAVQVRMGTVCVPAEEIVTLIGPNSPMIIDIVTNNPGACDIQNGIIVISAIDGSGQYQFSIDNGVTWQNQNSFSNLSSGTYQVVVRNLDETCLVSGGIITLTGSPDEPIIEDVFVSNPMNCDTPNDGIITIVLSNTSGDFEFSNDGGATWQVNNSFTNLPEGTYSVFVRRTDMTCQITAGNIQITNLIIPVIDNVAGDHPTSCNTNDGNIEITATPGIGEVEYSIDGGISWMQFNFFSNLPSGEYQPSVRNLDGSCQVDASIFTLNASTQPTVDQVFKTNPSDCVANDGQIIATAIPCGSNNVEYSIDGGNVYQPTGTFADLAAGIYEVLVRNIGETQTVSSENITLIAPDPPVIDDVASTNIDCAGDGGSITIQASGNAGFLEYSINGMDWQNTGQFGELPASDYTPFVRFLNSDCFVTGDVVMLSQMQGLTIDDIQTVESGCGQATGSITIIIVSGSALEFSIDGGTIYQASNFFDGLTSGNYTPTVQIVGGDCETLADPLTLQEDDGLDIQNVIFSNPSGCEINDGSITISVTSNSGDILYSINGGDTYLPTDEFINLSPGTYEIFVQNGNGTCPVEYALNPLMLSAPSGGPAIDEITITPPSVCGANDAAINILASGGPVIQYSIDGGVTFEFTNNFADLAGGAYNLVLQFPGSTCTTEEMIMVGDEVACDDIVNVTIPAEMTTEICFGPEVLQIVGTLTNTEFCNQGNPNTVFATIINNNCVSLAAQIGFSGLSLDTICTVHCYDNDPALCDTTYIVVTVDDGMSNCEDVFSVNQITEDYGGNPTQVCIALPILDAVNLTLILNGNAYNEQLFGCIEDSVIVYSYAPLTGNGFSGPYILNEWTVGSMIFSGTFIDANDLVMQMNDFDSMGMWVTDTDLSLLISTNSNEDYGIMDITHDPTSNGTLLQPNETTIANGTVINVPNLGINEFIVINPDDGCADTLLIDLLVDPISIDTILVTTIPNIPIFNLCATGDDIPGGAQSVGLFQIPANGGVILTGGLCGIYSPNLGFLGKDTFGLIACNNVGGTLCDSTVYIVCINPPSDVLTLDLDNTDPIDTCLTNLVQLPNGIASAEICGINTDEVTVVLTDDCINIDPNDDFMGTTEICVVHCDMDNNCDTTTIIVNVNLPCPDIFPANFLGIESSDNLVAVCVSADSMTLANLTLTLDGQIYDTPLESCIDDQGNAGTIIFVLGGSASHDFLVQNPDNGCSDNLTIIVQAPVMPMLDTIFVETPQGVTVDEICGNALDLPGNALNIGFCELPSSGTAPVVNDSCVAYIPGAGFVGNDNFCMIICDDLVPTTCDSFIIVISVLPPLDMVGVEAQTVMAFDTCLTSVDLQLQADILSTEICDANANEVSISIDDNCVTIDLVDDFIGTTEACIIHCYDIYPVICDTTILVITNENAPCPEIFTDTEMTILADDNGNAQLCLDIPFMEFGDYQINIDGVTYIGLTDGCNILGGVPEGTLIEINGIGDYVLTAQDLVTNCTDTLNITVMEGANVIEIETGLNTPSDPFCIDTMDLVGNFDTLILCDLPMNGLITIDGNCFTFLPNAGYLGGDEATIKLCDDLMNCDTFMVQITVNDLCNDFVFLQNDTVQISQTDCNENGTSCLPIEPSELIGNYNILDNGFPYNGGLMACDFDTCIAYNYFNLAGMGADGPYELTDWQIGGIAFTANFQDIQELVDSMNVWDIATNWVLDENNLEIKGCNLTTTYTDLEVTQTSSGATATLDAVSDFVPNGTQISLETGIHELIFIDIMGGCTDTLFTNVFCDTIPDDCGNMLLSEDFQLITNCDSTALFCFDIVSFDLDNFVVTINNEIYDGLFETCEVGGLEIALALSAGDYELIFNDTIKGCDDVFNVSVSCQEIEDIIIDTLISVDEMYDICLEDLGFSLSLIDSVVNVCADQTTGNVDFAYDELTGCITLLGEVIGEDTACFKMYLLDTCATVFINVTVQESCDAGFFSQTNYGLGVTDCDAGEAELCLPVLPLEFENTIVTVGGAPYTGEFLPCNEEIMFSYPYSSFPLGGADENYIIDSLLINDVVYTGIFDNAQEFLDSLNFWNPDCGWEIENAGGIISINGGCMDDNYGGYSITYQLTETNFSAESPMPVFVPNGVTITLAIGVGIQEITFTDTLSGCTDTIQAILACVMSDTIFIEIELGMTDILCLDTMDLVGNLISISNACAEESGEFVGINLLDAPCFEYTGIEGGTDIGCMVLCDDLGICDTTYVVITTTFDDAVPIAENDDVLTGINQVIVIDFLCSNDQNIDFLTSVEILTQPENGEVELVVDSTGTCLYSFNFVPDTDYCGNLPETFTYEICNNLGCDTAEVFVTINCIDITIYNGFSPNNDPNGVNEHFEIRGLNSDNYPGHIVRIFNRWGNRVYETERYENNPWTGNWEDQSDVPDGTYFYMIDLANGTVLKGYVQVHR
jgi:gliding motility-associated-like protein